MKKEQRERMLTQIQAHKIALAKLADHLGVKNPDASIMNKRLRLLEAMAHQGAMGLCNTPNYQEEWERIKPRILSGVKSVFGGKLPVGFFINADPRGYALKIDETAMPELTKRGIHLHRDWGGYGILSPTFDGN